MGVFDVTFVLPEGEVSLKVQEKDYLLDAARRAEIGLPSTCLQGWCITCAGRILQGKVDQTEALRTYLEDEEAGFVLLCSAHPKSNLKVLTHQKDALREHRLAHGLPVPRS